MPSPTKRVSICEIPPLKIAAIESATKAMKLWRPIWSGPRKRAAATETARTKSCGPTTRAALQAPPRRTALPVAPEAASPASVVGKPGSELIILVPESKSFLHPAATVAPVLVSRAQDLAFVAAGEEVFADGGKGLAPVAGPEVGGERAAEGDAEAGGDAWGEARIFAGQRQVFLDFSRRHRRRVSVAGVDPVDAGEQGDEDGVRQLSQAQPEVVVLGEGGVFGIAADLPHGLGPGDRADRGDEGTGEEGTQRRIHLLRVDRHQPGCPPAAILFQRGQAASKGEGSGGVLLERPFQTAEGAGQEQVVGIEEGDEIRARALEALVAAAGGPPAAALVAQHRDVDRLEVLDGAIGGAVVDDDYLARRRLLREDAGERLGQQLGPVVGRDDDRYPACLRALTW